MVDCKEIVDQYVTSLKDGFHCVHTEKRLRVVTPYLYPDNDFIEFFIEDLGIGHVKITDLGEVFRHLHSQGFDVNASTKRKFLAETIASRVNIDILRGRLVRETEIKEIAGAIFDMITALKGVADLIYTSRTYEPATFFEEVKDFLEDEQVKYESKIKVRGVSEKSYTVDFRVRNGSVSYLHTLSPKNSFGIKGKVDAVVRMWVDVNEKTKKVSLLNDVDFQWKEPDVSILERLSRVVFWSRRDELVGILKKH